MGKKLVETTRGAWSVVYTYLNHPIDIPGAIGTSLDILDRARVFRIFQEFRPDAVIHTAYSQHNLDVIVQGTEHIVGASELVGARLIHLSTDAVFDGERGWYCEYDVPMPIHHYGKAKVEAERLVACCVPLYRTHSQSKATSTQVATVLADKNAAIVRASLIWGLDPIDTRTLHIITCLKEGRETALFTDEYRCPICVKELAAAIMELLSLDFCGIIHIAGPERISRYEFGMKLVRKLGLDPSGIIPVLSRLSEMIRPRDCSMDTSLARSILQTRISSASELLA